jgi:hypothetical protein
MALGWLKIGKTSEKAFDQRLASLEPVFQAPPLTPELVEAIHLISTNLHISTDQASRTVWQKEQNGTSWSEYEALQPLFAKMQKPAKILEIGPGLGRSAVFFSKKLDWNGSQIYLYDANGSGTKYKGKYYAADKQTLEQTFCGNLNMLRHVLDFNGVKNFTVIDARETSLKQLPGPYDLIYSFYSIGFHWSLERFMDDLRPLMHDRTIAIFTVPRGYRGFPELRIYNPRVVEWKTISRKKSSMLGMLILSKSPLPSIGQPLAL